MTRRESKARWFGVTALTVAALACAGRADAQDTRVKVVIAQDVINDVMRTVDRIVNTELGGQIDAAIRSALADGSAFRDLRDLRGLRDLRDLRDWRVYTAAQNRDYPISQERRETKTVKLGAAGALELRNLGGNITVSAGSGSDATIDIVKVSRGRTDADAKLGLDRVTVDVEQGSDRASVTVRYQDDRRPPYSVSVAYHVKAPAGTRLTIDSLGGDITVTDIKGDMSTSTHGGNTTITNGHAVTVKSLGGRIALTGLETDGSVEAETLGGDVELRQVKARRVQASTVGGNVTATDLTCDNANLGTMGGNVGFSGVVAARGRYELHTNGGDVRFTPSGSAGYELQASTFAGEIRTDGVALQIQGSVTGRGINRSLRGTVGDGSALVILRTFSGTVTIGKK